MKIFFGILLLAFFAASCQDKTVNLLSKRWDYERIENVDTARHKFISVEDSVADANMRTAMQLLSWTFKKDMTYQCAVGNRVATQGTYALSDNHTTLTMMPASKSITNTYTIKVLTEYELVLSGLANDAIVTMHFRPHD